jgi:hypothetical protein
VADHHEPLARRARDQLVEIGDVVEEVVVAARADPLAVTVAAQVGRDDVDALREPLGDLVPAETEIEEAVDENERRVARVVPLEQVIREPGRERELA